MQIEPTTTGEATYCPEDNKLRLYVGRVPRAEFDALRAEGWAVCSKQREDGKGDFAAVWTPEREDTARSYAGGYIGDEDAGPAERAADRAERFSGYQGKRITEATGEADNYDSQDPAHGYQNAERANRGAARHDRQAERAVDAWGKAEYWQRRTAGVISHALYVAQPGVRMGRIKKLEAEQRKADKEADDYAKRFAAWSKTSATEDPGEAFRRAYALANSGYGFSEYRHPRPAACTPWHAKHPASLYSLLTDEQDPITGKEAAALWLGDHRDPATPGSYSDRWRQHYALRLDYERQMLEGQGGTMESACADIEPGGFIGGRQIQAVHKSPATGRVSSVKVWGKTTGYTKESGYTQQETRPCLVIVHVERLAPGAYRPPTAEERAAFAAAQKAAKIERKENGPKSPPIVNPTDDDADRLQAAINAQARERGPQGRHPAAKFTPALVFRMTQACYSANSAGTYSKTEARDIARGGKVFPGECNMWSGERERYVKSLGERLCRVRVTHCTGGGQDVSPDALRVIVLADRPQKALPAAVWAIAENTAAASEAGKELVTA